jgi:predicted CoA-binding protein
MIVPDLYGPRRMSAGEIVVVLGASTKPGRDSNQAIRLLKEHGHRVIHVHPILARIEDLPAARSLGDILEKVDTLTLYVGPKRGAAPLQKMIALRPKRVIMNPGTESCSMEEQLTASGIQVVRGCTLVMLKTGQF